MELKDLCLYEQAYEWRPCVDARAGSPLAVGTSVAADFRNALREAEMHQILDTACPRRSDARTS